MEVYFTFPDNGKKGGYSDLQKRHKVSCKREVFILATAIPPQLASRGMQPVWTVTYNPRKK